jgi:N-acetylmuramic acid 6-phosphate etherase
MKAGTAQKVVLNLLSTLVMIRLGRVYGGLMVDMRATNAKLRRRGARMVADIAGCGLDEAEAALAGTEGDLKLAVLVATGLAPAEARARLDAAGGHLRAALRP